MQKQTSKNKARFLMDIEYFEELHACLSRVESIPADHPDDQGAYIMIAMWAMSLDTRLPRVLYNDFEGTLKTKQERTLEKALEAVAANHDVYILLWDGAGVRNFTGYKEREKAEKVVKWASAARRTRSLRLHAKREVYESYDTTLFSSIGTSNHQKMVIFRWSKQHYYALIGGFNLGTEYQSVQDHGKDAGSYWHDTAVGIDGPAALVASNEWIRRWNKVTPETDKEYSQWLDRTLEPLPDDHMSASAYRASFDKRPADADITIATTNTEQQVAQRDIQSLMCRHIADASNYIYMENYALTDPTLVDALCRKLAQDRSVRVAVLVNHPRSELFWAHQDWARLMFPVYVKLTCARGAEIRFSKVSNNASDLYRLESVGAQTIDTSIVRSSLDTMINSGAITWTTPASDMPVTWRALIDDIESITPRGDPIMFGARTCYSHKPSKGATFRRWPYPHSKLALFDDRVAVVGSANWTVRSMEYDGEIAAFISGGNNARDIRDALLSHWWPNEQVRSVDDWVNLAKKAADKVVKDGEMVIEPLKAEHFARPGEIGFWKTAQIDTMYRWY
jgi:phosphatidylserine/phosphatidylglycerophosphate/cardiolipin synthase-like enzyme